MTWKRIPPEEITKNARYYASICKSTWAPVIQHSSLGENHWVSLFEYFPTYQIFFVDDQEEWVGFANTIPLSFNHALENLPDQGWDWMLEKGMNDLQQGQPPNVLGGLQIGVRPELRGQGFSKLILAQVKEYFKASSLYRFFLPIRPILKHLHPATPMEEYLQWKKNDQIYDPWIRVHLHAGAKIIKVCPESMRVTGTIAEWELWTGQNFKKSGFYTVEGALALVEIDVEKNKGIYLEPNIWIYYA